MLIIFHQSLVLAGNAKESGVLTLERMVVDRSADKIEFAVKELYFMGYGRKIVEVPEKPFISYNINSTGGFTIGAFFEDIEFSRTLDLEGVKVSCDSGKYSNLTLIVENWGDGIGVRC
jgi:hypothetical protein